MPYKDPEQQRAYQQRWAAARYHRRRAAYFAGKACVDCGGTTNLELDHVTGQKDDHRVWSWSAARREAELAKCVVRCMDCHDRRHGGCSWRFERD